MNIRIAIKVAQTLSHLVQSSPKPGCMLPAVTPAHRYLLVRTWVSQVPMAGGPSIPLSGAPASV